MIILNKLSSAAEFPKQDYAHRVLGNPIMPPFPSHTERAVFGLGCFWGAELIFWQLARVYTTMVGYAGGDKPEPTYHQVCAGKTGHCEVVGIIYDPDVIAYTDLLKVFWENHNPTQGMRQGNDVGSQYRSAVYTTTDAQGIAARQSRDRYQRALTAAGFGAITTEIKPLAEFYYAEAYHQQYLDNHPSGYCPHHATGVQFESA